MNKKSHCVSILRYMQTKKITAIEALNLFGCFRLASRINDLRNSGHMIITETIISNGKRFARYSLVKS